MRAAATLATPSSHGANKFCGAFTTTMKPKETANCSCIVMPTTQGASF
jgi:hypothetical protein